MRAENLNIRVIQLLILFFHSPVLIYGGYFSNPQNLNNRENNINPNLYYFTAIIYVGQYIYNKNSLDFFTDF